MLIVFGFCHRINGHPGNYKRIAGWRLEEVKRSAELERTQKVFLLASVNLCVLQCHPSGCLTDLFIQMSVIMLLKQTLNNIFEFTVPWVWRFLQWLCPRPRQPTLTYIPRLITGFFAFSLVKNCLSRSTVNKLQRKCGQCYRKTCRNENGHVEQCDICKLQDWLRNYHLADTDAFSLFNEFLEMGKSLLSFSSPLLFALLCTGSYNLEICSFLFLYTPVWGNICHISSHRKVSTHSRKMPLVALEQKAWKIHLIS